MGDRLLSTIGLAKKAGFAIWGYDSVRLNAGKIKLLVLSSDAGRGTEKLCSRLSEEYGAKVLRLEHTGSGLGRALGKGICAIAGITDEGFAGILVRMRRE